MKSLKLLAILCLLMTACRHENNSIPAPTPPPLPVQQNPEPASNPEPAPRAYVRASVSVHSTRTYDWDAYNGYVEGNTIRLIVEFDELVSVEGTPRLAIGIGGTDRYSSFSPWIEDDFPPERLSFKQRFEYIVHWEDRDDDGISIGTDAFDLSDGAFLDAEGVEVEVEIYSITDARSGQESEPGTNLDDHRVVARQEPRVCTDEREMAVRYGTEYDRRIPLVDEWDGTPFRFYWDNGIPESERADAEHYFDVVERLAERIEDQIGYPVLEVAGWIPEEERGFRIAHPDIRDCTGVRPGGIVGTVVPKIQVGSSGLIGAGTKAHCAVLFWTTSDIDTTLDGVMAHEIWHLFGFTHHPESTHRNQPLPGVGVPMSIHLTNTYITPRELGVTYEDVDALRCVFPQGG